MIGEPHLKILQTLDSASTATELAEELGHSVKHVSETLNELEEFGLASSQKEGRTRVYKPTETTAVTSFRKLINENPYVDFPSLLTHAHLHVLYYLDQHRSAKELELLAKPSRTTVYRVLKQLRNRGIVSKTEDRRYIVRQPFEPLVEFTRELALMKHTAKNREQFPGGQNHIVWNNTYEHIALIREISGTAIQEIGEDWLPADSETEGGYYLTGLELLEPYGLEFLTTPGYHVFYTEEPGRYRDEVNQTKMVPQENGLPIEDVLCHLAITQGRTMNQRYTLLAIARFEDDFDIEVLLERAVHYDIQQEMESMLNYLEKHGDVQSTVNLPSWDEFERVAAEYEVEV